MQWSRQVIIFFTKTSRKKSSCSISIFPCIVKHFICYCERLLYISFNIKVATLQNYNAYSYDRSLAFMKSTLSGVRTNMELLIAETVARMLRKNLYCDVNGALQRPITVSLVLRSKIRPKSEYYSQNGQD